MWVPEPHPVLNMMVYEGFMESQNDALCDVLYHLPSGAQYFIAISGNCCLN